MPERMFGFSDLSLGVLASRWKTGHCHHTQVFTDCVSLATHGWLGALQIEQAHDNNAIRALVGPGLALSWLTLAHVVGDLEFTRPKINQGDATRYYR